MVFGIFRVIHSLLQSILEHFYQTPPNPHSAITPLCIPLSLTPTSQPETNTNLLSVSVDGPALGSCNKWSFVTDRFHFA